MPNKIQSYRKRIFRIKNTLQETSKGNNVLETLRKHKLRLLDILHHKDVPEKDKQRIVRQLKVEGKLK